MRAETDEGSIHYLLFHIVSNDCLEKRPVFRKAPLELLKKHYKFGDTLSGALAKLLDEDIPPLSGNRPRATEATANDLFVKSGTVTKYLVKVCNFIGLADSRPELAQESSMANHKAYLLAARTVNRSILKRKVVAKKKPVKNAKAKKKTVSKTTTKVPAKLPVSTFDAWMEKQVRAEKKGIVSYEAVSKVEVRTLPKDTFDLWIEKQKPKESSIQKSNSSVPDTFDLWMSKQVSIKESEDKVSTPEVSSAPSAT